MSDIEKFIAARKARNPRAWAKFDENYRRYAIGMLLSAYREQAGLTLSELARRTKMKKAALSRIENHGEDVGKTMLGKTMLPKNRAPGGVTKSWVQNHRQVFACFFRLFSATCLGPGQKENNVGQNDEARPPIRPAPSMASHCFAPALFCLNLRQTFRQNDGAGWLWGTNEWGQANSVGGWKRSIHSFVPIRLSSSHRQRDGVRLKPATAILGVLAP